MSTGVGALEGLGSLFLVLLGQLGLHVSLQQVPLRLLRSNHLIALDSSPGDLAE